MDPPTSSTPEIPGSERLRNFVALNSPATSRPVLARSMSFGPLTSSTPRQENAVEPLASAASLPTGDADRQTPSATPSPLLPQGSPWMRSQSAQISVPSIPASQRVSATPSLNASAAPSLPPTLPPSLSGSVIGSPVPKSRSVTDSRQNSEPMSRQESRYNSEVMALFDPNVSQPMAHRPILPFARMLSQGSGWESGSESDYSVAYELTSSPIHHVVEGMQGLEIQTMPPDVSYIYTTRGTPVQPAYIPHMSAPSSPHSRAGSTTPATLANPYLSYTARRSASMDNFPVRQPISPNPRLARNSILVQTDPIQTTITRSSTPLSIAPTPPPASPGASSTHSSMTARHSNSHEGSEGRSSPALWHMDGLAQPNPYITHANVRHWSHADSDPTGRLGVPARFGSPLSFNPPPSGQRFRGNRTPRKREDYDVDPSAKDKAKKNNLWNQWRYNSQRYYLIAAACFALMSFGSIMMWVTLGGWHHHDDVLDTSMFPYDLTDNITRYPHISDGKKPRYVLYRILGNDLPPRHQTGQTLSNLQFILDHEPDFVDTEKWWLLNRIVDPVMEKEIMEVLTRHRQKFVRVPFRDEEYVRRDYRLEDYPLPDYFRSKQFLEHGHATRLRIFDSAYHDKNQYVMNNNGGRNHAILHGRHAVRARWILPFDGNAFLTKRAWGEITRALDKHGERYKYLVVPMHRLLNNSRALDENFRPLAREEPQIIFREDAEEVYDSRMRYGRRSKLELLWRLGVLPATPYLSNSSTFSWEVNPQWRLSPSAGRFLRAGFVLRLFSGRPEQEIATRRAASRRAYNRMLGVQNLIDTIDESIVARVLDADEVSTELPGFTKSKNWWAWEEMALAWCRDDILKQSPGTINGKIASESEEGVRRWSGRILDWANRMYKKPFESEGVSLKDFLNAVRPGAKSPKPKPGEKVEKPKKPPPATDFSLIDPATLPETFRRIEIYTLAWFLEGDGKFAGRAVQEVRFWILGQNNTIPSSVQTNVRKGLNEKIPNAKQHLTALSSHIPPILDAIHLLHRHGHLPEQDWHHLRIVFGTYLRFLLASDVPKELDLRSREWTSVRGDVALASLSGFLGDVRTWNRLVLGTRMRVGGSLGDDTGCIDTDRYRMYRDPTKQQVPEKVQLEEEELTVLPEEDDAKLLQDRTDEDKLMEKVKQQQKRVVRKIDEDKDSLEGNTVLKPVEEVVSALPLSGLPMLPLHADVDTVLDALSSRSHLLQEWISLSRVFESGYGRFHLIDDETGGVSTGWQDPTKSMGFVTPEIWRMQTGHAKCKNVSVGDVVIQGVVDLGNEVERFWRAWNMASKAEMGLEDVLTGNEEDELPEEKLKDELSSDELNAEARSSGMLKGSAAGHGTNPLLLRHNLSYSKSTMDGSFESYTTWSHRQGDLTSLATPERKAKLRVLRARLQYIAQIAGRLQRSAWWRESMVKSASSGELVRPVFPSKTSYLELDVLEWARTSPLKLGLYDDEPGMEKLGSWQDLWTQMVMLGDDGGELDGSMDLPFAWMLGIR